MDLILTFGGLKGYSGVKDNSIKNVPPSYGELGGPAIVATQFNKFPPFGPTLEYTKINTMTKIDIGTYFNQGSKVKYSIN